MNARSLSVTLVGWLFIAAGLVGLIYHATEFRAQTAPGDDLVWVIILRLLAVVGGVFLLRGASWARWLLITWLAYHVVLSARHSLFELAVHAVLLAVVSYLLLSRAASGYFSAKRTFSGP